MVEANGQQIHFAVRCAPKLRAPVFRDCVFPPAFYLFFYRVLLELQMLYRYASPIRYSVKKQDETANGTFQSTCRKFSNPQIALQWQKLAKPTPTPYCTDLDGHRSFHFAGLHGQWSLLQKPIRKKVNFLLRFTEI